MEISAGHKSEELCPNSDHMELEKSGDTIEVTSFIESFSRFHIPKLTNAWPEVEAALQEHGISYKLNLAELYMTVSTTPITKDPGIIHRAREVIVLLSKTTVPTYVPTTQINPFLNPSNQTAVLSFIITLCRSPPPAFSPSPPLLRRRLQPSTVTDAGDAVTRQVVSGTAEEDELLHTNSRSVT
ncbi:hypothetical protein ACLB2K_044095 [Fragaria x ananassa]